MEQGNPALVLRWLLDLELAGDLEGLTAVAITRGGRVHYIALRDAVPAPVAKEAVAP